MTRLSTAAKRPPPKAGRCARCRRSAEEAGQLDVTRMCPACASVLRRAARLLAHADELDAQHDLRSGVVRRIARALVDPQVDQPTGVPPSRWGSSNRHEDILDLPRESLREVS